MLILAGCGGSGEPKAQTQLVKGRGFSFQAPAGWRVQRSVRGAAASQGSELVQVSTFPLVRPYTAVALRSCGSTSSPCGWRRSPSETGGTLTGTKTVTAGGVKSHRYDVEVDGHVDQYTFVLIGKREYQLLCRFRTSSDDSFCSNLLTSFQPA